MLYINTNELVDDIEIPESVSSIGSLAFNGCKSLKSVVIPDNVVSIGYRAFYGTYLKNIEISNGITSIGREAFGGSLLTSVTFANTDGWYVTTTSGATSGTDLSAEDLANVSTAATYLKNTYKNYYWYRSDS